MLRGSREETQSTEAQRAVKKIITPQERLGMDEEAYTAYKLRFAGAFKIVLYMVIDTTPVRLKEYKFVLKLDNDTYASGGSIRKRVALDNQLYAVKKLTDNEIQEFIAAPLFRRVLYGRAPKISLIKGFGIASKFFKPHEFSASLSDFEKENGNLDYVLNEYEGIELIIAVAMRFGDIDINPKNILTDKLNIPEGVKKRLQKIDHGWALTTFFTNEGQMRQAFFKRFSYYVPYINLRKLKDAIILCCSVSSDEIEDMVKRQIYFLKKQKNLKPPFEFQIGIDDELSPKNDSSFYSTVQFLTLDDYGEFIIDRLKKQGEVLRQCLTSFYWIFTIAQSIYNYERRTALFSSLDPLVWAIQNHINIGGLSAIEYVKENKLLNPYIIRYLINEHKDNTNLLRTFLQPPKELINDAVVIFCLDANVKLHDQDPMDYAVQNNLVSEELARYAAEKKLKINGMDAFEYGVQHNMLFKGLHPIVYALTCNLDINDAHPFEFWDPKKPNHNHVSIYLEVIQEDCYKQIWNSDQYQVKHKEMAKFALMHGLAMYGKNAIEFLESVGFVDIDGLELDQWVRLNCKTTRKISANVSIGVATQLGI